MSKQNLPRVFTEQRLIYCQGQLQPRKSHGFSLPFHTLNISITCFFQDKFTVIRVLRRRGEPVQKAVRVCRRISIYLGLLLSTVRQIVYQRKKFSTTTPLSGTRRPTKIGVRVNRKNLKQVTQNHGVTVKRSALIKIPRHMITSV